MKKKVFPKKRLIIVIVAGLLAIIFIPRIAGYLSVQKEIKKLVTPLEKTEMKKEVGRAILLKIDASNYAGQRQYRKALKTYEKILKEYPQSKEAAFSLYQKAQILEKLGKRKSILIRAYEEVIKRFPDSYQAVSSLDNLKRIKEPEDAVSFHTEIIGQYPDNEISRVALERLVELKKKDELLLYQRFIREYPDKYIAEVSLDKFIQKLPDEKKEKETEKFCKECTKQYASYRVGLAAYEKLVNLYQKEGKDKALIDLSLKLIKERPKTNLARKAKEILAKVYFNKGNYLETLNLYSDLMEENEEK